MVQCDCLRHLEARLCPSSSRTCFPNFSELGNRHHDAVTVVSFSGRTHCLLFLHATTFSNNNILIGILIRTHITLKQLPEHGVLSWQLTKETEAKHAATIYTGQFI